VVSDLIRGRPIWFGGEDRSEASMRQFYDWLGKRKAAAIRLSHLAIRSISPYSIDDASDNEIIEVRQVQELSDFPLELPGIDQILRVAAGVMHAGYPIRTP